MSLAELKNSYLAKCETDWERSKRDCLGRLRDNFGDGKYAKLALRILALTPDVFRKFCGVNITAVAPYGYLRSSGLRRLGVHGPNGVRLVLHRPSATR